MCTEGQGVTINADSGNALFPLAVEIPPWVENMGIVSPNFRDTRGETWRLAQKRDTRTTERDSPIIRAGGPDDTLTLADRDFCDELTRFRAYRCREGNYIVMTSLSHKMIGDGMEPERFLPSKIR